MDFILWWQTLPSKMDPILLSIGSFSIYWYSTMYLVAFGVVYLLCRKKINNNKFTKLTLSEFEDLLSWCFIALILGARFGYVLFYNFEYYLANPLEILLPFSIQEDGWKFTGIAGMSYHGGLIGVLIAMWMYGRKKGLHLYTIADFMTPAIPLGFFFGRIGNFINGELWGSQAHPEAFYAVWVNGVPRHASQLYEACLEGLVLFLILWAYSRKVRPTMAVTGIFLFFYGTFRSVVEFVRLPDTHLNVAADGYLAFGWLTMGHVLSLPMILFGAFLFMSAYRHKRLA